MQGLESGLERRVAEYVERNWDREVAFLRELVGRPTTMGREESAQRVVAEELGAMGLRVDCFDVDQGRIREHPAFVPVDPVFSPADHSYEGRPNVVGTWPASAVGGRSLILNGHVDVVSVAPEHLWSRDPWAGEVEGERMYGRGTADMKGGIAAMVYAVAALKEAGVRLRGDLSVQSVIEEEGVGSGALATLERGYRADAAIVTEPSDHMAVDTSVGLRWARVVVRTSGAHALAAGADNNAINKACLLIDAVRDYEEKVNGAGRPARYRGVDHPLNCTTNVIRSGDWPSTVPAEATFEVRLAYYPGADLEAIRRGFTEHLLGAARSDPYLAEHPPEITFFGSWTEGYSMDQAEPIFGSLGKAHGAVLGDSMEFLAFKGGSDARFFNLYYGIPAAHYGPAGGNYHAPDEWVDLGSVKDLTKILALAAADWCGVA